jgi:hypothetical protein
VGARRGPCRRRRGCRVRRVSGRSIRRGALAGVPLKSPGGERLRRARPGEWEASCGEDPVDDFQAPARLAPETQRAGPRQLQGSVGSRAPNEVSARGSAQSLPMSSDSPGSAISSVSPMRRAARSERAWTSSTCGPGRHVIGSGKQPTDLVADGPGV